MKKALLSITVLGFILFFGITVANAQTPQDIAKKGIASSVSVTMKNGSYGSGFFVLPDQIATAYHLVEGSSEGDVSPVLQKEKYPILGITAIDKENDLVILKVSGAHGMPLSIGDSGAVEIQDEVIVVGNPLGYERTVTDGKIINNSLGNQLLMDAKINRGSSGGALLNSPRGEVIGVVKGSVLDIHPELGNIGQDLNIAIPSKYLTPLVEKAKGNQGSLKPLSVAGVTGTHLTWWGRSYRFTLHNQRNETIRNLHCLVIFKDNKGIICADQFKLNNVLFAGEVDRVGRLVLEGEAYSSVPDIDDFFPGIDEYMFSHVGSRVQQLMTSYEIRIRDFDIDPDLARGLGMSFVPLEGVTGSGFKWLEKDRGGDFFYFLYNNLRVDVKNVFSYVVFYDEADVPIAESIGRPNQEIPAMGNLKVEGDAADDVKQLTARVEFRIYQWK